MTIPHIRRDGSRLFPRDRMASNGGVCICCICMCLQEVNGAFPLGGSKWRTRPYSQRRYQGFSVKRAYPSAPLLAFTRFAPGIFSAEHIYRSLGAAAFSISFLYIIFLYPFRYIYIVLSILSITARRKAAAIPNVRDKPPRGLHRRPSVPRRRYSPTPPARPKTRRRQRAKKAGG